MCKNLTDWGISWRRYAVKLSGLNQALNKLATDPFLHFQLWSYKGNTLTARDCGPISLKPNSSLTCTGACTIYQLCFPIDWLRIQYMIAALTVYYLFLPLFFSKFRIWHFRNFSHRKSGHFVNFTHEKQTTCVPLNAFTQDLKQFTSDCFTHLYINFQLHVPAFLSEISLLAV